MRLNFFLKELLVVIVSLRPKCGAYIIVIIINSRGLNAFKTIHFAQKKDLRGMFVDKCR
jgi:hypothetical protein